MKQVCTVLMLMIALSFASAPVQAALHSKDDPVFGPGSITYDDQTGLEWLDPTLSTNISFNDIVTQFGQGGAFAGWRHATLIEANELAIHAGITINIGETPQNFQAADRLISLLGVTNSVALDQLSTLGFIAGVGPDGPAFRNYFAVGTQLDTRGYAGYAGEQEADIPEEVIGHFLVRDTFDPYRTFRFEGKMPNGQRLEVAYTFNPSIARVQDVGAGIVYDQFWQGATIKIDGVAVPATFIPNMSRIYIQNNLVANQNYDRYQAILEFSPTVTAGGVSFDRIFVYGEDPTAAPTFSTVLNDQSLIVDSAVLFKFPILKAYLQLGNGGATIAPDIVPIASAYDEAVSGDIPSSLPLHNFNLGIGVNKISGTESIDSASGFDVESFAFTVPEGAELESIEYEYAISVEPGALSLGKAVSLWRGTFVQSLANQTMEFLFAQNPSIESHSPVDLFTSALPLEPGNYVLGNAGIGHEGGGWPGIRSWNYTIRFTVRSTASPDTTPPTVSPTVLGEFLGLNGWYRSDVTLYWVVNDDDSAVFTTQGCRAFTLTSDTTPAGVTAKCTATSGGGATTQSATLRRDATRPNPNTMFGPLPNIHGWNNSDVTISFDGTDPTPGSGIDTCFGNRVLSNEGTNLGASGFCRDIAGNTQFASASGIRIDKTSPTAEVLVPQNGAAFAVGSTVTSDYSCDDALSGILSCNGPAPAGSAIDTTTAGGKSFTVTAIDYAGNVTNVTTNYTIAVPAFTLSPATLAFGSQGTGQASPPLSVTLTNAGLVALPITTITRTGANANQFSTTNDCGTSVAPGASCTIIVTFLPTTAGAKVATLNVNAGGGAGTKSVSLSGTGVVATYSLAPTTLSFGDQARNVSSGALGVALTNSGSVPLAITSITRTGTNANQFSQTSDCGTSVAAGASCTISVVFLPTSVGAKVATLNVNTGGGAGTKSASLSGTGIVPTFTLAPATLAFGNQTTTVTSAAQPITLTNTGSLTLSISTLALSGGQANQFSQTSDCGPSVAAGGSCTISVVFLPTSAGSKTTTLTVTAGGGATTQTVGVSGTGVVPTYSIDQVALAFGNQARNVASPVQVVTLTNTSPAALVITSITRTGTNANQFSQTNDCGTSVPAGGSCTISVVFLPTSAGDKVATLNVNAGGGAGTKSVSLGGTGIVPLYTVAPASLDFGSQPRNTSSTAQTVTLNNTGELALPITSIAMNSGNTNQFSQTNDCGSSLAVGATCSINVVFRPTTAGAKTTNLRVVFGGGAATPALVPLTGTGT